jgi:hypothetical protein
LSVSEHLAFFGRVIFVLCSIYELFPPDPLG